MDRNFFNHVLRMAGRIPDEDLEESAKEPNGKERRYYTLFGNKEDELCEEGLPDEYFEDDDTERINYNLDQVRKEKILNDKKDRFMSDLSFYSFLFILVAITIGTFALLGKIIYNLSVRVFSSNAD